MDQNLRAPMKITTPGRALLTEIVNDNLQRGFRDATPLPGYIRSEVILGQQNQVRFPIRTDETANGQAVFATERRLDINDAFYIKHYSVMFYQYVTATAGARARAKLHTFPNLVAFGLNAPEVDGAYNGNISLRVDDRVYIDAMDMARFRNVGAAQEGLAVSTAAANNLYQADAWQQNDAFANETDPLVRLNGPGKNLFTLNFPDQLDFTKVAGSTCVAVLYLRGWQSQNGGGFRSGK